MSTLFRGGSVFDGLRHRPGYALLVDDAKVVAVLSPASLERLDPHDHEVVDLAGGLVSPGFTDAHCHPIQGGLERMQCDLTGGSTREEYVATVARLRRRLRRSVDHRRRLGDGGIPGRHSARGRPRRGAWPTVRCCCHNRDHHGAWANSRALELAGHHRRDPRPAGRPHRAARRTAAPRAPCTRVRWTSSPRCCLALAGGVRRRAGRGPGSPLRAGRDGLAGRDRRRLRRDGRHRLDLPRRDREW